LPTATGYESTSDRQNALTIRFYLMVFTRIGRAVSVRSGLGWAALAYVDRMVVAGIVFTSERLEPQVIDRYPSIIANFRMATTAAVLAIEHLYAELPAEVKW